MKNRKRALLWKRLLILLDDITRTLEDEEITLEDSFQAYKKGMDLLKICNDKIDKVEKKVMMLNEEGGLDEF